MASQVTLASIHPSFLYYTTGRHRRRCRTSIRNKHNSRTTTNIGATPHIWGSVFHWHTRQFFLYFLPSEAMSYTNLLSSA